MLKKEFTDLTINFFAEVSKTVHALKSNAMPKSITASQYMILEILYFAPGKQLVSICDCLHISMPNGSRETRRLIEKGLLTKKQDSEDKRNHFLYLTDKGNELVSTTFDDITKNVQKLYAEIDEASQNKIADSMKTLLSDFFIIDK